MWVRLSHSLGIDLDSDVAWPSCTGLLSGMWGDRVAVKPGWGNHIQAWPMSEAACHFIMAVKRP